MFNPFLTGDQQAIVVFWLWKSLNYWIRMVLGPGCILVGLFLQYHYYYPYYEYFLSWQLWLGLLLIFMGNLFLLVRDVDNRVRFGAYSALAEWENVDESKLLEAEQLVKRMKKWDRSILDASSNLGCFTFFILLALSVVLFLVFVVEEKLDICIIILDAALLLLPHWLTGKRLIMDQPNLLLKIKTIKKLLQSVSSKLQNHQIEYFMLLKGHKTKAPDDVKFCIKIQEQHPDFLGLYGQIVINRGLYPYFYVVLVTKKGYGLLHAAFEGYSEPGNITKEYKVEKDVEVFVIRQRTTKTSGYHTNDRAIEQIFLEGLRIAQNVATK